MPRRVLSFPDGMGPIRIRHHGKRPIVTDQFIKTKTEFDKLKKQITQNT